MRRGRYAGFARTRRTRSRRPPRPRSIPWCARRCPRAGAGCRRSGSTCVGKRESFNPVNSHWPGRRSPGWERSRNLFRETSVETKGKGDADGQRDGIAGQLSQLRQTAFIIGFAGRLSRNLRGLDADPVRLPGPLPGEPCMPMRSLRQCSDAALRRNAVGKDDLAALEIDSFPIGQRPGQRVEQRGALQVSALAEKTEREDLHRTVSFDAVAHVSFGRDGKAAGSPARCRDLRETLRARDRKTDASSRRESGHGRRWHSPCQIPPPRAL